MRLLFYLINFFLYPTSSITSHQAENLFGHNICNFIQILFIGKITFISLTYTFAKRSKTDCRARAHVLVKASPKERIHHIFFTYQYCQIHESSHVL